MLNICVEVNFQVWAMLFFITQKLIPQHNDGLYIYVHNVKFYGKENLKRGGK